MVWGRAREVRGGDGTSPLVVPSSPSFFVHLGTSGPHEIPLFSTGDGARIPIAKVVDIGTEYWNLKRVDLPINAGTVVVRYAGFDQVVATYTVDPAFVPRTRSVELLPSGMTLWIDSDAVGFRVNNDPLSPMRLNDGRVHVETGVKQHVVALYPNGSEEVIYDDVPVDRTEPDDEGPPPPCVVYRSPPPDGPVLLVLLLLGLAAFASFATPRID